LLKENLMKDDTFLATSILVLAVVAVISVGLYFWKNKKLLIGNDSKLAIIFVG
jgi:hypothetical protein